MIEMTIVVEGLAEDAAGTGHLAEDIERATYRALNLAATKTRTKADNLVRSQVAFPAAYLRPSTGNQTVAEKARTGQLDVVIQGRGHPASRARFATYKGDTGRPAGKDGLDVIVKPGAAKFVKGAFIIKLRNGNRGFAIRTPGGPPSGAYKPRRINEKLWLLYGPSVDQVLYGTRAVRDGAFGDVEAEAGTIFEDEFWRQLDLVEGGAANG